MLKRTLEKWFLITLLFSTSFYYVSTASAAPSITSLTEEVIDGSLLTITGTGFGAGPTVHKWDNFEEPTHTVGQTIGAGPGTIPWKYKSASESVTEPKVDNTSCRTNSTKHIRCNFDYNRDGNKYRNSFQFDYNATFSPVYITWWFKWDRLGSAKSSNMKPFWPVANDPERPDPPRFSACAQYEDSYNWVCGSDQVWDGMPTENDWVRFEFYGVESSNGAADGTIIVRQQDSAHAVFNTVWNDTTQQTRSTDTHWESAVFGDYVAMGADIHYHNDFDDIYIANSRARVEIGNDATWTNCTNREIQIPTNWSNDSITITVNQGSFSEGETAYLFVVDADGNVSNGYPITIGGGGGGDSSAPYTSGHSPAKDAVGFYRNSNIIVHLQDSGDGVDQSSIVMTVNGQTVSPTITGTSSDYTLTYDPPYILEEGDVVVTLNAQDLANPPNVMSQETCTFTVNRLRFVE